MFHPPGYEPENTPLFRDQVPTSFRIPANLAAQKASHVEVVNDFHYAMVNDSSRNQFYWNALKDAIRPEESIVIEIGTGAGLLAIMAASLGAKHVYTIEASTDMADVARRNIETNHATNRVTVLCSLSTDIVKKDLVHGIPTILVAEILGTLLLSEDALTYMADVRQRLMDTSRDIIVIPEMGVQYASLIQSDRLLQISQTQQNAFNIHLDALNYSRNEATAIFTKHLGARLTDLGYHELVAQPLRLFEVDFRTDHAWKKKKKSSRKQSRFVDTMTMTSDGRLDAFMYYWTVSYKSTQLCTHPAGNNFENDIGWGQALQLLPSQITHKGHQFRVSMIMSDVDQQFQLTLSQDAMPSSVN